MFENMTPGTGRPVPPTESITLPSLGISIPVESLPEDIKFEISTLDAFKRDMVKLLYELDKVDSAITVKRARIEHMVSEFLSPTKVNTD